MTDDQLRALVRDAVARHLGGRVHVSPGHAVGPHGEPITPSAPAAVTIDVRLHPSHYRHDLPAGGDETSGGASPCLIEPRVSCNHCGYCQSHGH